MCQGYKSWKVMSFLHSFKYLWDLSNDFLWLYLFLFSLCSDGGRPNNANIFISGFVLGGIIVGTLGCVYAPQVIIEQQSFIFCMNANCLLFLAFLYIVIVDFSYIILCLLEHISVYFFCQNVEDNYKMIVWLALTFNRSARH